MTSVHGAIQFASFDVPMNERLRSPLRLPPTNRLLRLAQTPKHQLADPALAARLLGIGADALVRGDQAGPPALRDGDLFGRLFESLVTLSVRTYAQASEARVHYLRTRNGDHEVDLIVVRDDGRAVAIEVKLSPVVTDADVRHLRWLRERVGEELLDAIVVTRRPPEWQVAAHVPPRILNPI